MKYKHIWLGQSVLKIEVPIDIYMAINHIYESNLPVLKKANKQLVGKIENEHSLFYDGPDNEKMTRHNKLTKNVYDWFLSMYSF